MTHAVARGRVVLLCSLLAEVALLTSACGGSRATTGTTASHELLRGPAQRGQDSAAKRQVRNAELALEKYAVEKNGSYLGATPVVLEQVEPELAANVPAVLSVESTADSYTVTSESLASKDVFRVVREPNGDVEKACEPADKGECPPDGVWGSTQ